MSKPDPLAYLAKARRALKDAEVMLENKSTEGACNRAYYAMFNAAHYALIQTSDTAPAVYKTHRGLIAAFGEQVILGCKMDPQLGRAINTVEKLRQLADYLGDPPPLDKAQEAVAEATAFVAAIAAAWPKPGRSS